VIGEIWVIALRTTRPRSSPARSRTDLQNLTHTTRAHFPSELPLDAREGGRDDDKPDRLEGRDAPHAPIDDRREAAEQDGLELGHPVRMPGTEIVGLAPARELPVLETVNDGVWGLEALEEERAVVAVNVRYLSTPMSCISREPFGPSLIRNSVKKECTTGHRFRQSSRQRVTMIFGDPGGLKIAGSA
jgi:hypothetical protein